MRTLIRLAAVVLLFGAAVLSGKAAFSSMYVFGDGLSTTTNNTSGLTSIYYGGRYSNGRVWVEVLAQRQGINIANNWSYFNDNSANLVTNLKSFTTTIPANALVVVWVNNSDLFDEVANGITDPSDWTATINTSQANHLNIIGQLYAKGARTLIMPTPVDVGAVPYFDLSFTPSYLSFVRQECLAYSAAFSNTLNQARASYPGLTIYEPNFFSLLDNVLTNASAYGLTNTLQNGVSIDAIDALWPACNTNGLGDNYVYWDPTDPSARFHEIMADTVQQSISPVRIGNLTILGPVTGITTNEFQIINVPVGLNGYIDSCTNLSQFAQMQQQLTQLAGLQQTETNGGWTMATNILGSNITQSFYVYAPPLAPDQLPSGSGPIMPGGGSGISTNSPVVSTNAASGAIQCYRLRFPLSWTWP